MARVLLAAAALAYCVAPNEGISYQVMDNNTNGCLFGHASPQNEMACRTAATALNLTFFRASSWENFPKGCVRYTLAGNPEQKVLFNEDWKGSPLDDPEGFSANPICTANFYFADSHSESCPDGLMDVKTEAMCQTAAAAMGFLYGGNVSFLDYPGGCFQFNEPSDLMEWGGSHTKIFFNLDQTLASVRASSRLICRELFFISSADTRYCYESNGHARLNSTEECRVASEALGYSYGYLPREDGDAWNGTGEPETDRAVPAACQQRGEDVAPCAYFNYNPTWGCFQRNPYAIRPFTREQNDLSSSVVCKKAFTVLEENTMDCTDSEGNSDLLTEVQCQAAARTLGTSFWSAQAWKNFPPGCLLYTGTSRRNGWLLFNRALVGKASPDTSPICIRDPAPVVSGDVRLGTFSIGGHCIQRRERDRCEGEGGAVEPGLETVTTTGKDQLFVGGAPGRMAFGVAAVLAAVVALQFGM